MLQPIRWRNEPRDMFANREFRVCTDWFLQCEIHNRSIFQKMLEQGGFKLSRKIQQITLASGFKYTPYHSYIFLPFISKEFVHWIVYMETHVGNSTDLESDAVIHKNFFEDEKSGFVGRGQTGKVKDLTCIATSLLPPQFWEEFQFPFDSPVVIKSSPSLEISGEISTLRKMHLLIKGFIFNNKSYIIMKKIFGEPFSDACQKINHITTLLTIFLNTLNKVEQFWTVSQESHGDLRSENILCNLFTNEINIIDFETVGSGLPSLYQNDLFSIDLLFDRTLTELTQRIPEQYAGIYQHLRDFINLITELTEKVSKNLISALNAIQILKTKILSLFALTTPQPAE